MPFKSTTFRPIVTWISLRTKSQFTSTFMKSSKKFLKMILAGQLAPRDLRSKSRRTNELSSWTKTNRSAFGNSFSIAHMRSTLTKKKLSPTTSFTSSIQKREKRVWFRLQFQNQFTLTWSRIWKEAFLINASGSSFRKKLMSLGLRIAMCFGQGISSLGNYYNTINSKWRSRPAERPKERALTTVDLSIWSVPKAKTLKSLRRSLNWIESWSTRVISFLKSNSFMSRRVKNLDSKP